MEYGGGRTAETIVSWVEKKTGPVATTLDSVDAAKKFVEDNAIAVVGFFADLEGDAAKAFKVIFQIFINQMQVDFGEKSPDSIFRNISHFNLTIISLFVGFRPPTNSCRYSQMANK